jgi:hypothetical protein
VRLDGVNTVAVGAHRRLPVAAGDRLPVNALRVFILHRAVALGAGLGHVELEDGGLGIAGAQDLVRAMAVGAHCRLLGTGSNRAPVDAFLVGNELLRAVAASLHDELLPVTGAAGGGDVGAVHARFRVGRSHDLVRAAVAIQAPRGLAVAVFAGLGVEALVVCGLLLGVAAGARGLCRRGLVGDGLDVVVAIGAAEHAVNRAGKVLLAHVEADRLAFVILAEGLVVMAGETVGVGGRLGRFGLRLGGGHGCLRPKQQQGEDQPGHEGNAG